ncbi:NAC domain-containing protein 72 [Phtheirospermum japonicum]|uniref:NAC domain-containing protein 72 n=1 Tax=Phtheirospermum japonicum TaxID=374723 RepID=A0A830DT31_9LAMI|nr:NAC domain-containing protein 72 [Phtheirospermum japonicum]
MVLFQPAGQKVPKWVAAKQGGRVWYWKATGTDKIITNKGRKVGIKKALVFYLDEWVLCRIYKKNSSAQKPTAAISGSQSREYSLGSSSSSSSQYDDVLDSLPDINDHFLSLPRMNSIKDLQQLGSGNFDWATLAGLNPLPEPSQTQQNNNLGGRNDTYAPSLQQFGGNAADDEVQSGGPPQRVGRPGFYPQNAGGFGLGFSNSVDPFVVRYPTQPAGLGFRQ